MSVLSQTHALQRLLEGDATWRLLRADNAPAIAALLSEHLGGESRRLPAAELYELLDHDLDVLRGHGFPLPQRAQAYCAEWRKAGFLTRRAAEETRGETFELAPGALGAIRFLEQLAEPRASVTESRLASIASQLGQLAGDTDPDATRRLEQLYARRDRINAQIERINAGEVDILDRARAVERMRDILAQAEEIPSEFARVRERFEQLNRDLRARIVESTDSQRAVLDEVFRGVDPMRDRTCRVRSEFGSAEELAGVLQTHGRVVAALSTLDFETLLSVVRWLVENPSSGKRVRQLPIRGIDTKWLEQRRDLVEALHGAASGRESLGLVAAPGLVRVRFLDPDLRSDGLADVSAPVDELARLAIRPQTVFVFENLETVLSMPDVHGAVAVHGSGYAANRLGGVPWVRSGRVVYWGDLDSDGFAILHALRSGCSDVTSVLMNEETLLATATSGYRRSAPRRATTRLSPMTKSAR